MRDHTNYIVLTISTCTNWCSFASCPGVRCSPLIGQILDYLSHKAEDVSHPFVDMCAGGGHPQGLLAVQGIQRQVQDGRFLTEQEKTFLTTCHGREKMNAHHIYSQVLTPFLLSLPSPLPTLTTPLSTPSLPPSPVLSPPSPLHCPHLFLPPLSSPLG